MKLRLPSPALVIAIIALVVACAGTAYAATRITSSSQIKSGVVTGGDIRNGSIQNADVKSGTLSLSRLSKGTQKIVRGAGGTKVSTFEAFRKAGPENQPPNAVVKIATLKVPGGVYSITAKTVMTALAGTTNVLEALADAPGSVGGHCKLETQGDVDESRAPLVARDRPQPITMYMQLTRTVGATTSFDLLCDAGISWRTSDTSIIATKVGDATRTESTG